MARDKQKSARSIATAVLNQFDKDPKQIFTGTTLNKLLRETDQKQRATDLVSGTIRNRLAIDAVIAKLGDCPAERIPAKLLNVIRVGAYELIYNPQTAEHAIVNEAVENVKAVAGKKQVGFVNALLRQITRGIKNRRALLSEADPEKTLPQTLTNGCEFDIVILPEPKTSPEDYFSCAFSLPKWLVAEWLVEFGFAKTRDICFASNRRPSIYLRPNKLKTTVHQFAGNLRQADIDAKISPDESMIKLNSPAAVTDLPGFSEGLFVVQDITASRAVRAINVCDDWVILDICAAPGTKTTQLAEMTNDKAIILATDIDLVRLEKIKENITRLQLNSVEVIEYENLQDAVAKAGPFDCVLLDVPCSNSGVLAKRLGVRYRINSQAIQKLAKIQLELLNSAATMLKPQGKICYSTCSIQKEENGQLVRQFLRKNNKFELESELLTLPSAGGFDHDGGYVAIISRLS